MTAPTVSLRGASVAAGLASQFVLGGSGAAWAPGTEEHLSVHTSAGKYSTLGVAIHHARPELADATLLFPDAAAADGAGYRDEFSLLAELQFAFDIGAFVPTGTKLINLLPRIGFSAGAMFTDTHLDLPSFDGLIPYRARAAAPLFGFGIGLEARALRWLSLVPRLDALLTAGADENEISGGERFETEWRLSPGVDLVVWF